MFDVEKFVAGLHEYMERAFAPLAARIAEIESKPAPKDGEPGKSVTLDDVTPLIAEQVRVAVELLPRAKDGDHGKSITVDDVRPVLADLVADAVKAIPPAEPGKSVTLDDVTPMIAEAVEKAAAAIPAPKDGKDGATPEQVAAMIDEAVTKAVAAIPRAKDGEPGASVSADEVEAMVQRRAEALFGKWALEFERRGMDLLQRTADRMPTPKDGADGLSLDDLTLEDDGDGTLTVRFVRGDVIREKSLHYPRGDRGVYRDDGEYRKSDGVTFGGSFWIAQKDAPEGKPGMSSDWRLCVKRGRDGKDGRDGIDKAAPVKLS